jgi:LacI family transcriptional regulator, galactose operon repressor
MPASRLRQRSRITIDEVATRAGVSISTVSRVLNQSVSVTEDATARVLAAVADLGYVPQTAARHLAQGRTSTLGLLLPDIGTDFFSPLLRSINAAAAESGYDLLIAIHRGGEAQHQPRQPLGKHNTDGLLVFDNSHSEAELRHFHQLGFPAVLLYRSAPEGSPFPSITIENKSGACQVVDHLIEAHGRQRIAFLRGPAGNEDSIWRERGYRESLAAHGIPFDPTLVGDGEFYEAPARATVERWLTEGLQFDAIFAGDDGSAVGALTALGQAGRRVPEDVALAGFDDDPMVCYLNPPLTTVRAPTERVGREAVQQLVRLIQTGKARPMTLLPTELVLRRSCGCGA